MRCHKVTTNHPVAQDAVPAEYPVTQSTDTTNHTIKQHTNAAECTFRRNGVLRYLIAMLLIVLSFSLFAETLKLQSFEDTPTDTWTYTANPTGTVPYFWGRTNQTMGGASAQSGTWYWASWLMEANEASMSFANVSLTPGTQHSLNFHYYSKNLSPATDILKVCVEYDTGTQWNNWMQLLLSTQAWSLFSVNIPQDASTVRVKILTQYTNADMDKYVHWDSFSIKDEEAEFTAPIIYNTSVAQRTDGSGLVDISYDLFDANGDLCEVKLKLSSDGGSTFAIIPDPAQLSGDIGTDIAPGTAKEIVWNAGAEGIDFDGDQYMLQFVVEDGQFPIPENFVFVAGGTVAGITVSDFYLDKYQLTQAGYQAVMGTNPASGYGVGSDYPVYRVSWFNAIEYCNRRSLQEGLIPCYSYSTFGTSPDNWPSGWNMSFANAENVNCDFSAIGYRLPRESEWEYAARGGLQTHGYTYSGSNNIDEVAWYSSNSGSTTHSVGTKLPNELGLYDMSGNVWEWCWDIHSGSGRVRRGGSWNINAYNCPVSYRADYNATFSDDNIGFRVCRCSP